MLFDMTFQNGIEIGGVFWLVVAPITGSQGKKKDPLQEVQYNHMADGFACTPLTSARRAQGREKLVPTGLVEGKAWRPRNRVEQASKQPETLVGQQLQPSAFSARILAY